MRGTESHKPTLLFLSRARSLCICICPAINRAQAHAIKERRSKRERGQTEREERKGPFSACAVKATKKESAEKLYGSDTDTMPAHADRSPSRCISHLHSNSNNRRLEVTCTFSLSSPTHTLSDNGSSNFSVHFDMRLFFFLLSFFHPFTSGLFMKPSRPHSRVGSCPCVCLRCRRSPGRASERGRRPSASVVRTDGSC